MERKSFYTLLIISILINFLLSIFYYYEKKKGIINIENSSTYLKYNDNLKNKYFIELNDNYSYLDPCTNIVTVHEDTLMLGDIVMDMPKLIFTFSRFTCSACIENEIIKLKQFEKEFGHNIIVLTNFTKVRDLIMFTKFNKIDYPIYIINDESLKLNVDQLHLPYFFVLDNDVIIKDIFIIDQDAPDITQKYLELISNKYFNI